MECDLGRWVPVQVRWIYRSLAASLSRRELLALSSASKNAETLILRSNEVAVLRRGNRKSRTDRAVLATVAQTPPRSLRAHRIVAPGMPPRWHQRIVTNSRPTSGPRDARHWPTRWLN